MDFLFPDLHSFAKRLYVSIDDYLVDREKSSQQNGSEEKLIKEHSPKNLDCFALGLYKGITQSWQQSGVPNVEAGSNVSKSHEKEVNISLDIEFLFLENLIKSKVLNWVRASPTEKRMPLVVALVGKGYF